MLKKLLICTFFISSISSYTSNNLIGISSNNNHLMIESKDNKSRYIVKFDDNGILYQEVKTKSGTMIEQIKTSTIKDRDNYTYLNINDIVYSTSYTKNGNTELENKYVEDRDIVLNIYLIEDYEKTKYKMSLNKINLDYINNKRMNESIFESSDYINVYEYAFSNIKITEYEDKLKIKKELILKELNDSNFSKKDLKKLKEWKNEKNIKKILFLD